MATLLPNGKQQFEDANGSPLVSGLVYMFIPNTSTPKDTYQDSTGSVLNTNPIELDASGQAIIYGVGVYRQVVYNSDGDLIWDQITASTDVGGLAWGGVSTGSPNAQEIATSSFSQQDGQQIAFIVGPGLTNSGAATVSPGGVAGIPVLLNSPTGPTPLSGGEMVAGNEITLVYSAPTGAFHLVNPAFGAISSVVITNSTITNSTITLKQASDPSPTGEGDIQWSTLFDTIKIGDGTGTVRLWGGVPGGLLYGMSIANNGTDDIDFATGKCADSTAQWLMALSSGLTKQLDSTWAAGTNQGGLFSGSIANGTYHCFIIMRPDTNVVDAGFSTSAVAADRPVAYTYFRRIGSIIRSGGVILDFVQDGDAFFLATPVTDATYGTSTAQTLTTMTLPLGIRTRGQFQINVATDGVSANEVRVIVTDPSGTAISQYVGSASDGGAGASRQANSGILEQFTNTSSQVYAQVTGPAGANNRIITLGWIDRRGQ